MLLARVSTELMKVVRGMFRVLSVDLRGHGFLVMSESSVQCTALCQLDRPLSQPHLVRSHPS